MTLLALVAGCGSQPVRSAPVATAPPTAGSSMSVVAVDACFSPLTRLGDFSRLIAPEVASLRPLLVAQTYDTGAVLLVLRGISTSLTGYAGLEPTIDACDGVADLSARLAAFTTDADAALAGAFSAPDAQRERDAAVRLLALLPSLEIISADARTIADERGIAIAIAIVPTGADQPLGSLPPLPTPTPLPTLRPVVTPKPVITPKPSGQLATTTATRYFTITGDHPIDLVKKMTKIAPTYCGRESLACVRLATSTTWTTTVDPNLGTCTIASVTVRLRATLFLPRWTRPAHVASAMVSWWHLVRDHISWHEARHISIEQSYLARMRTDLVGESCSHGTAVVDRWAASVETAQRAFDARDHADWSWPDYDGPGGFWGP